MPVPPQTMARLRALQDIDDVGVPRSKGQRKAVLAIEAAEFSAGEEPAVRKGSIPLIPLAEVTEQRNRQVAQDQLLCGDGGDGDDGGDDFVLSRPKKRQA